MESWTDDTVIGFTDSRLQRKVRELTGITSRDITYGDVKNIVEFGGDDYTDITPLKYFTSLEAPGIQGDFRDVSALENLTGLRSLYIEGENLEDISSIGKMTFD